AALQTAAAGGDRPKRNVRGRTGAGDVVEERGVGTRLDHRPLEREVGLVLRDSVAEYVAGRLQPVRAHLRRAPDLLGVERRLDQDQLSEQVVRRLGPAPL